MPSSLERYKLSLFILVMLLQLCFFSGLVLTKATSKHYSIVYTKQNTPHTIPATSFLGKGETRPVILVWHCLFMNYYYYLDICKSTLKRWGFFGKPDMSDFSSQERWSICWQHFQSGIELIFSNSKSEKRKKWRLSWNQYLTFSASITCYCVLKYFYSNRQRIINFMWIKGLTGVSTGEKPWKKSEIGYEVEKSMVPKQIQSPCLSSCSILTQ